MELMQARRHCQRKKKLKIFLKCEARGHFENCLTFEVISGEREADEKKQQFRAARSQYQKFIGSRLIF
jgi:hypothetical protein